MPPLTHPQHGCRTGDSQEAHGPCKSPQCPLRGPLRLPLAPGRGLQPRQWLWLPWAAAPAAPIPTMAVVTGISQGSALAAVAFYPLMSRPTPPWDIRSITGSLHVTQMPQAQADVKIRPWLPPTHMACAPQCSFWGPSTPSLGHPSIFAPSSNINT